MGRPDNQWAAVTAVNVTKQIKASMGKYSMAAINHHSYFRLVH